MLKRGTNRPAMKSPPTGIAVKLTDLFITYDSDLEEGWMDNFTFGVTMMVTGMGGTLLALALLAMLMNILKLIFPFKPKNDK